MQSCQVYGHIIHTNFPLNLPSIQREIPDYQVIIQDRKVIPESVIWVHDFLINEDPWFRVGKLGSDYILRFINYADFLIDEKNKVIYCSPSPKTQINTIEHLLLDQVIPRMLSQRDYLVLHAGAVYSKTGTIGFLGQTGCGKSTLTGYFGRNGHPVITDDCVVLEHKQDRFWVLPSYPAIRLNPDMAELLTNANEHLSHVSEYSSKMRVNPSQGGYIEHNRREALCALFILAESKNYDFGKVSIKKCSMRDTFSQLIQNTFRLDPTDKQSSINEFHAISRFVSSVPVYTLTYPRQQSVLENVMQATLDLLIRRNL